MMLGGLALVSIASHAAASGLALMVPAYFYPSPGSDWDRLAAAASRVPLVAIMNPASGPGNATVADPQYTRAIRAVRQAGGRITGYVSTAYGKRPVNDAKADIRRYHDLYALDGFFLDEMANDGGTVTADYYSELYGEIRRLKPTYHVTGNPGTQTQEVYLSRPTVDTVVTFENGSGYAGTAIEAWNRRYPSHRFCHLLHSVPREDELTRAVALAQQRNAGFLFVTDDTLPNPWDRLPSYWDGQVQQVQDANRDAADSSPPRLDLQRRGDGQGRMELEGPAGRYVIARSAALSALPAWTPLATNLTFTGQWALEPILWIADPAAYFRVTTE